MVTVYSSRVPQIQWMSKLQIAKAGTAVTRRGDRKISARFPKEAEMFFPTRHLDRLLGPSSEPPARKSAGP